MTMEEVSLKDYIDSKFCEINRRLDRHDKKLDSLNTWRWKTVGQITTISAIITFAVNYILVKVL